MNRKKIMIIYVRHYRESVESYYLEMFNVNRRELFMARQLFLIQGNICGARIRLGRALQKPPITQEELARKINLMGMEITPLIISRIEKNQRHICDAELKMIAKALGVSMEWLCGEGEDLDNR